MLRSQTKEIESAINYHQLMKDVRQVTRMTENDEDQRIPI